MRSRNIKPGFFCNELLGTYDPIVSLLFAGLWCLADKDGRLEDRPLRIKAELFPYREGLDVNGYLTVLARDGFIERYRVGDLRLIQVLNFTKHQSPHHTEKPKGYPENTKQTQDLLAECSLTPLSNGEYQVPTRSDSLIPDSLIHGFTDSSANASGVANAPLDRPLLEKPTKRKSRAKKEPIALADWLAALPEDQDAIPADDSIWDEMDAANIPAKYQTLAWQVFKRDWANKTAKDWPATFRDAIRRGWIKIWYFRDGECVLNSAGMLALRSLSDDQ